MLTKRGEGCGWIGTVGGGSEHFAAAPHRRTHGRLAAMTGNPIPIAIARSAPPPSGL
jgi:hypothetical protein